MTGQCNVYDRRPQRDPAELKPPTAPLQLSYDIKSVSRLSLSGGHYWARYDPWKQDQEEFAAAEAGHVAPGTLCEKYRRWSAYVAELPLRERRRYAFKKACQNLSDDEYIRNSISTSPKDPYLIVQMQFGELDSWTRPGTNMGANWKPTIAKMREYVALDRCIGRVPNPKYLIAIDAVDAQQRAASDREAAALAEHQRCEADPACRDAKRDARLSELTNDLCGELAERTALKGAAKQEWAYGRETGVVDVRYLGDIKGSLAIRDMKIFEAATKYEDLAGKKFNAKACR